MDPRTFTIFNCVVARNDKIFERRILIFKIRKKKYNTPLSMEKKNCTVNHIYKRICFLCFVSLTLRIRAKKFSGFSLCIGIKKNETHTVFSSFLCYFFSLVNPKLVKNRVFNSNSKGKGNKIEIIGWNSFV